MLPHVNATLTQVTGPGLGADYDTPATGGTVKWTGRAGAYWMDESERLTQGGASSILIGRTLIVDRRLPITWEQGDTVTVQHAGQTKTGQVRRVQTSYLPGVQSTVRLTMETG